MNFISLLLFSIFRIIFIRYEEEYWNDSMIQKYSRNARKIIEKRRYFFEKVSANVLRDRDLCIPLQKEGFLNAIEKMREIYGYLYNERGPEWPILHRKPIPPEGEMEDHRSGDEDAK